MQVVLNMACGLANRMFEYCFYLYLRNKGYDARILQSPRVEFAHERVDWGQIFTEAKYLRASAILAESLGGTYSKQSCIRRKRLPWSCRVKDMNSPGDISLPDKDKSVCLLGFIQNAEMVESLGNIVYDVFRFQEIKEISHIWPK